MKQIIENVTSLFNGKKEIPNADPLHNAGLLEQARAKIETGVFTRYFKKSFFVTMEIAGYLIFALCVGLGISLCCKLHNLFEVLNNSVAIMEILEGKNYDKTSLNLIEWLIYFSAFLPAVISFFWARSYTKARRKINLIVEVERLIERVIFNLRGA
jgi:hypothetical protein